MYLQCWTSYVSKSRLPLFWLGHSLGGHVGLAALGKGFLQDFDGMLLVSTNVWLPSLETSFARRLKKSLTIFVIRLFLGLLGSTAGQGIRVWYSG